MSQQPDPRRNVQPQMTSLGLQNTEGKYDQINEIGGHLYKVPPINRFESKQSKTRFERIMGSMSPKFTPDGFDRIRERLQTAESKERSQIMEAIGVLYSQKLSEHFLQDTTVDHSEFEKMCYPKYVPMQKNALRALGLTRQTPYWKPGNYTDLENISRLCLEKADVDKEAKLTFEEWYSLFWNYYSPFNAVAFFCLITGQSFVYTREFVDSLALYISERLRVIKGQFSDVDEKAPVLFLGSRIGKLGWHLNQTKVIPVPVLTCHENPNTNPYLLAIPAALQPEFKPMPIEKLRMEAALEKYKPSLVLMAEMEPNKDHTQLVRSHGCVMEYVHVGMAETYLEGHGWNTWGHPKFKERDDSTTIPPWLADGWTKRMLPHVSRHMISKYDSDMATGFGTTTSFCRTKITHTWRDRVKYLAVRLATRY